MPDLSQSAHESLNSAKALATLPVSGGCGLCQVRAEPQNESKRLHVMTNTVDLSSLDPESDDFGSELVRLINKAGYLVISNMDFDIGDVDSCSDKLLAFCRLFADPIPHNPDPNSLIWDIKAVTGQNSELATFSEVTECAELHTDNAFAAHPDDFFCLLSLKAASCGGGESTLLNVTDIIDELRSTPEGREAEQILRTKPYPFAVPSIFQDERIEGHECNTGLVLIDDCIRFRTDVIEDSIAHRPDLVDDSQIKALNLLTDIIAKSAAIQRVMLNPNELIIIDNKRLLHGREAFEDTSRHLLRVRLRERPALSSDLNAPRAA